MDRRKTADVLFYALQCAKLDRISFADSVSNDPKEHKDALADVKAFEALQRKIFGTSDSQLDNQTKRMTPISIINLKRLVESNPELFIHGIDCECEYCRQDS